MNPSKRSSPQLTAVRAFADNALEKGRDRWSGKGTPLFADGLNTETGEPVEWLHQGNRYVVSNLASQQNFFRTLDGLSVLAGEPGYKQAAKDATACMFERFRSPCGLLYWGGHTFVDLRTLQVVHIEGPRHEIKMHLPHYPLLWETDPEATARFVRAYWNGDIMDWRRLELNRHADYGKPKGLLWDSPWDDPPPLFESTGHASVMPVTDLTWAAAMLHKLSGGEEKSLLWARRLEGLLVKARHPETGLGAAKISVLKKQEDVPEHLKGTRQGTFGRYGDRSRNVFGAEFGPTAIEAWRLWGVTVRRVYVEHALEQMALYEELGEEGRGFLAWTVDGLRAWAQYAYVPDRNHFRALWADGTDMTGCVDKGFHGYGGGKIEATPADSPFWLAYARVWRLSGESELWETLRNIAKGNNLGEMGSAPGDGAAPNLDTDCCDPFALLATLELLRGTGDEAYLQLARVIGGNIVARKFRNNLFAEHPGQRFARFDAVEPLALLHLEAAERGEWGAVPQFVGGAWRYLQGPHEGHERTTDQKLLYANLPATPGGR